MGDFCSSHSHPHIQVVCGHSLRLSVLSRLRHFTRSRLHSGHSGYFDPRHWRLSQHCNNTMTTEKNPATAVSRSAGGTQ